jgi:hypothetical protein
MARRAFDFIAHNMSKGDRLGHSWRDGKLLFPDSLQISPP